MWLHSLKVAQLLRSAACLHTNQSRSYLNHLVHGIPLLVLQIYQKLHLLSDSILGEFLDISPCSLIIHNGIHDLQCGDD